MKLMDLARISALVGPLARLRGKAIWALAGVILLAGSVALASLLPDRGRKAMPPFLGLPERLEVVDGKWTLKVAFPNLEFDDPVALVQAPLGGPLFVCEREGQIFVFDDDSTVTKKRRALDLSKVTQGEVDSGLLGLVFHPEFGVPGSPNRAYAYVHYAYSPNPIQGKWPPYFTTTRSRLSRFNVEAKTGVFDRKSELILIDQEDENIFHQGGSMFFHPKDGFLYLSVGDEGSNQCALGNCQRIDKDLFSGVLRIDVDQRGGSVSHPIPRQPETGTTAHYFIPNDNPFVGMPGVLEEFYAIGLRSPHRITYDKTQDITWIADVGQKSREELDILKRAANYQWNVYEGFEKRREPPENPLGIWTDPVLQLPRDQAASIIGGNIYRGKRLPGLFGKYIYGDFVTGNIWALDYEYDGQNVKIKENELLLASKFRNRKNGITSFGIDNTGEMYVLTLGKRSKILRLMSATPSTNAPKLLSQLGFFAGGAPPDGLLPYDVQNPLWSDGSQKRRWLSLPAGAAHYAETGPWRFPDGTVFVKNFAMALDERHPDRQKDLETRFLVAGRGGEYYGITYRWNADGTDADAVLQRKEEELEIIGADGQARKQTYVYPGPFDCMTCHNEEAGSVLGVRTEQLNQPVGNRRGWFSDNPLVEWSRRGVLDAALNDSAAARAPHLVALEDESSSVESRLRSYWASNCAMCHGSGPRIRADWDARWSTPFEKQGILYGVLENGERVDGERMVIPGDLERSAMFTRSTSNSDSLRMPPIGRRRVDATYARLLEQWITSLPTSHASAAGEPSGGGSVGH
jgi:glucose/arabinose dehydrogenase